MDPETPGTSKAFLKMDTTNDALNCTQYSGKDDRPKALKL